MRDDEIIENIKAVLGGVLAFAIVALGIFCGIITSGDIGPLTWEANTKAMLIMEGEKISTMDCLNQYLLVSIGGEIISNGGRWVSGKEILQLWDNQNYGVVLERIPDGTKVTICEKKFWWMHRHFIVCK